MKNKIIFLDCDGVLNKACLDGDMRYFHPECFAWFKDIVSRTGAKVVLSSSWREYSAWYEMLRDFFAAIGIDLIDKTGTDANLRREDEIAKWVLEHRHEVAQWVVIDDWDMSEYFHGHFVSTCSPGRIGLDKQSAEEAITILNSEQPENGKTV